MELLAQDLGALESELEEKGLIDKLLASVQHLCWCCTRPHESNKLQMKLLLIATAVGLASVHSGNAGAPTFRKGNEI